MLAGTLRNRRSGACIPWKATRTVTVTLAEVTHSYLAGIPPHAEPQVVAC